MRPLLDLPDPEMAMLCTALGKVQGFGFNGSARRIAAIAGRKPVTELSPKFRHAAIRIAHRFRRQLPPGVQSLFLRFSREQLRSRPQDYTWEAIRLNGVKDPLMTLPVTKTPAQGRLDLPGTP